MKMNETFCLTSTQNFLIDENKNILIQFRNTYKNLDLA